jgi:response regulator RpfG family c-di-GMP phosphodiesterase
MPINNFQKLKLKNADLKLMVVDHEQMTIDNISNILSAYKVFEASDIATAKEVFIKEEPHIVLVNYDMPEKNGLTFLKELKKINSLSIRIIMGYKKDVKKLLKGMDTGVAYHYIWKPMHIDSLKNTVRRCAVEYIAEYNQKMLLQTIKDQVIMLEKQNQKLVKLNQKIEDSKSKTIHQLVAKIQVLLEDTLLSTKTLKKAVKTKDEDSKKHLKKIEDNLSKLSKKIKKVN